MAFKYKDRVQETTTTTGTGSLALGGAATGYQSFNSALSSGDTCHYAISDTVNGAWEVGLGTFTSPSTLARTTILASSNSNAVVSLAAATKQVFITVPTASLIEGPTINVKSFGALGDGSTDDTAAINAAIAAGGITFFPAGTYIHTGLSLPGGAYLKGVGSGSYGTASPTSQRSILKMKNATNANSLTIAAGNSYGRIEGLEIDGNKANQTTAGIGISFADAVAAEECGWELRRVQVVNAWGEGIYVGTNRQAVYGEHVLVNAPGNHGVHINGSDSTWVKLMVGNTASGWKGIVAGGVMSRLIGGEVWSTVAAPGMVVTSSLISVIGMGFDHNDQQGVLLDTGSDTVSIVSCSFHSNSQQTANTYSDIKVNVSGNYTISGCNFGALDGGITNKRKYAIEVGSNTAIVNGSTHITAATGTSFTDSPANIGQRTYKRVVTVTQSATPAINTDITDVASITGLAQAITSMTTNLTGTPNDGDMLIIRITDNGTARAITWGTSFEASTVALPTTTVISTMLMVGFAWNAATSKWRCIAAA